ncbi:hypothetical protein L195_g034844, partial [Trifolium pratense]
MASSPKEKHVLASVSFAILIDGLEYHISEVEYRTIFSEETPTNFLIAGRSTFRLADVLVYG